MEVTNASPSLTSPPEGSDLCVIDVTNVVIHSVTLIIGLCGLAGNGAVLWLLSLKSRVYRIFRLAVTDFFFLLFSVPSALVFLVEELSCSPIVPPLYLSFLYQLSLISYYRALYRLMPSKIGAYINKLLKLCYLCRLPARLQWVLNSVQFGAFFALFTVIPMVASLCHSRHQEHCRAALTFVISVILLLFVAPMLISSTIDFIKAKWGSQQQKPKKHDIVIFIIVLLTLLIIIVNFLQQLGYIVVPTPVVFLLTCIHSSIKPFIYFFAGRCWSPCSMGSLQLSLQRVFEEQKKKKAHRKKKKPVAITTSQTQGSETVDPFLCSAEGP